VFGKAADEGEDLDERKGAVEGHRIACEDFRKIASGP